MLAAIRAVLVRELIKMFRQKTRLLSAMVRPLIWLFVIGGGIGSLIDSAMPGQYQRDIVPGIIGMTILFGSMLSSLSTVYDKESGIMRMMIVAPIPTYWIVACKMLASTVAGSVQAALVCVLLLLLGFLSPAIMLNPSFLLAVGLTALACAALGMVTSALSDSLDNFASIMNFVIFPVFFLSGALYPVRDLPAPLLLVSRLNPFSYGVDLMKRAVDSGGMASDFGVALSVGVLVGFSLLALVFSSWRLHQEARQARLFNLAGGRSR
ncbi:MAG: ABC transporter permease [Pseudomonadales bacterium]|nr:ABC transporter permease [Pseudomonadales bacterium]